MVKCVELLKFLQVCLLAKQIDSQSQVNLADLHVETINFSHVQG